jgi:hypothetical protein
MNKRFFAPDAKPDDNHGQPSDRQLAKEVKDLKNEEELALPPLNERVEALECEFRTLRGVKDDIKSLKDEVKQLELQPGAKHYRTIRSGELAKAAGALYGIERNEVIHGGNLREDVYTIKMGELDNAKGENVERWKVGFTTIYGVEYDEIREFHHQIPESILTTLNNYGMLISRFKWRAKKKAARSPLLDKTEELRDRWVRWFRGTKAEADLSEIVKECREANDKYSISRHTEL